MSPTEAKAAEPPRRGRGRPRDSGLQERIKAAALLVLARHGYSGMTLERVCAEAGVTKATFYRRWDTPTACVMEAFLEVWSEAEFKDTGAPAADLEAFAHKLIELYSHSHLGACSVALQTEARVNREIGVPLTAGTKSRRNRNTGALAEALARMTPPPALPAAVILNVLNGVARNIHSLNWPVSDEELRTLIQSLLSPPAAPR
ncbi:TetR/AcrR family transcriptional regulator [Phenylobacterium sp. 58.2.17]|uniref:TetR/AcrR family transcriptional regulator n=1 Tax=Phenylobacterium sp. 58.2.17 TaxID=2969306 RepID=UPI00226493BA|nr:TetR/AcrR family transcriptional regulator [Phenylobacterium sp. 58.2.17]MCX7585493.1 TetR/AcrR family transcriptional regulator [Phenylobacterium sp. 58.2.17]